MGKKFSGARLASTLLAISLLAILTIMMTACSGGAGPDTNPNTVHMNDTDFDRSSITIKKGETITLANDVSTVHVIENGIWDNSGTPKPNREAGAPVIDVQINGAETKTFGPFNTAGTFHFYCTLHNGMNLTVIVQ
jgi:plastocyanin